MIGLLLVRKVDFFIPILVEQYISGRAEARPDSYRFDPSHNAKTQAALKGLLCILPQENQLPRFHYLIQGIADRQLGEVDTGCHGVTQIILSFP